MTERRQLQSSDHKGLFITFEGGEGAGKTTQINRLVHHMNAQGHKVITTREPGGTPEAESIRNLLVQRDGGDWDAMAEVLLLSAARVMHVNNVIMPALAAGKTVICDRFTDSTLAYQGYGRGLDHSKIMDITRLTIGDLAPDMTIILDIDVTAGLSRSQKRLSDEKGYSASEDRFERMDLSFHEKLRAGFLDIAKNQPQRCRVIDAARDLDAITHDITNHVTSLLQERPRP